MRALSNVGGDDVESGAEVRSTRASRSAFFR